MRKNQRLAKNVITPTTKVGPAAGPGRERAGGGSLPLGAVRLARQASEGLACIPVPAAPSTARALPHPPLSRPPRQRTTTSPSPPPKSCPAASCRRATGRRPARRRSRCSNLGRRRCDGAGYRRGPGPRLWDRCTLARPPATDPLRPPRACPPGPRPEAAKRGLLLVDTKYEFGKDADGNIMLIDEVWARAAGAGGFVAAGDVGCGVRTRAEEACRCSPLKRPPPPPSSPHSTPSPPPTPHPPPQDPHARLEPLLARRQLRGPPRGGVRAGEHRQGVPAAVVPGALRPVQGQGAALTGV
jgi:hypothetical protein